VGLPSSTSGVQAGLGSNTTHTCKDWKQVWGMSTDQLIFSPSASQLSSKFLLFKGRDETEEGIDKRLGKSSVLSAGNEREL